MLDFTIDSIEISMHDEEEYNNKRKAYVKLRALTKSEKEELKNIIKKAQNRDTHRIYKESVERLEIELRSAKKQLHNYQTKNIEK
jgi:hypothetical protein